MSKHEWTLESLMRLGERMRHAQKEYFRTRSDYAFREAKKLEKRWDNACLEIRKSKQAMLWE